MPVQDTATEEFRSAVLSSHPCAISLEFDTAIPCVIRSRMDYAFRVFAAVYGHTVADAGNDAASVRFLYAKSAVLPSRSILIPARYQTNSHSESAPILVDFAGESIPLFLGVDTVSGNPDWLGEIFLWLSGELETNAKCRDSVGRVPFSETPFGKYHISPKRPHVALLLAWLENTLRGNESPRLPRAPSPIEDSEHIVLPSHDIDYYFSGFGSAFLRLVKNLIIASRPYKSSSYFLDNLRALVGIFTGKHPGEYLSPLLHSAQTAGFQSTLFPVVCSAHRRDPNYSLECIAEPIAEALSLGFSLGLHGSYRSAMEDHSLASEASILRERFGRSPRSNRQHWLRFESQQVLFREVDRAGMLADSSAGFPESTGFRNGASFSFPPYDFDHERPHRFLEIPLVLMDGGLEAEARGSGKPAQEIAIEVLEASKKVGWGGISILWHNPVESLSVPREINDVFWRLAERRANAKESWLTFDRFLHAVLPRYQRAGLLEGICLDA